MLSQLVYRSHRRCAHTEESGLVPAILSVSRRNNARDGLTGFLLLDRYWFFQVLEGERARVFATYERIRRDPRHGDLELMSLRDPAARSFPTWSMAGAVRGPAHQAIFLSHNLPGPIDPEHVTSPAIVALGMDLQDLEVAERLSAKNAA